MNSLTLYVEMNRRRTARFIGYYHWFFRRCEWWWYCTEKDNVDDQDGLILRPPLDIPSTVEAIEYMHKALQFGGNRGWMTTLDQKQISGY